MQQQQQFGYVPHDGTLRSIETFEQLPTTETPGLMKRFLYLKSNMLASLFLKYFHLHLFSLKIDSIIFKLTKQLAQESQQQQQLYTIPQIILIQAHMRGTIQRKKFKSTIKLLKYRNNVLKELLDTEKNYVDDLKFIIDQVIHPIKKLQILSQEDIFKVFVNIEALAQLNNQFHNALQSLLPYKPYKLLSPAILNFIPFFKIYFEYCKLFTIENIYTTRKNNPFFDQFIENLEGSPQFRGLNLSAFLVKPVQRLPQYVLLFKDFLRNMDKEDRDYKGMTDVLKGFTKVNSSINDMIVKVLKNSKMFELQRIFGDPNNLNLLSSSRIFIQEETLNVISKNSEKPAIVYIMNDLLLISEREEQKEELYKTVHLSESSFCKDIDSHYFHNVFGVIGRQKSITFSCENYETKQKLMALIDKLISDLKEKTQQNNFVLERSNRMSTKFTFSLKVNVVGTEERSQWLSRYTVYIIFIDVNGVYIKLFLRYRELVELQKIVTEFYPSVELPKLPTSNWLTNLTAKVIESRKILIEDFLQTLFQSETIREDPSMVLQYLNLPPNLYCLNEEDQYGKCPMSPRVMSVSDQKSPMLQKIDQLSLCQWNSQMGLQREENRNSVSSNIYSACDIMRSSRRQSRGVLRTSSSSLKASKKYGVKVHLVGGGSLVVEVEKLEKFSELMEKVAQRINLQAYLDFRLVLKNEKGKTMRVLDEDEIVTKCLQIAENNKIVELISQLLFSKLGDLYLVKYLYLPDLQEQQDYQSDPVRLGLLVDQIFYDVTHDNYLLNFADFRLYCAFYLLIHHPLHDARTISFAWLKRFLPDRVSKSLQLTNWAQDIYSLCLKVSSKAAQAKLENQIQSLKHKLTPQEIPSDDIYKLLLLKTFSLNQLYGVSLFKVKIAQSTIDQANQIYKLSLPLNTMIGISLYKFMIVSAGSHSPLFVQPITNLEHFHFYPDNLRFQITQLKLHFSFITKQVFEIQRLINEYEMIRVLQNSVSIMESSDENQMMQDSVIEVSASIKQIQLLKRVM